MAELPKNLAQQTLARINAAGAMANEHILNFQKALDWGYEIDRKLPSLPEAFALDQFRKSEAARLATEAAEPSSTNANP